jgi:hypothetical protein
MAQAKPRRLRPWLFLVAAGALGLAGCGSEGGPDTHAFDMTVSTALLSCGDYLLCLNGAAGESQSVACDHRATIRARVLFQSLNDCITNECAGDGGLAPGACGGFEQCLNCVQSGRSTAGHTNGTCTNQGGSGGPEISDPECGRCVDAVVSCYSDVP